MSNVAGIDPQKSQDHYDLDDGDLTHPIYVDYLVPAQASGIIRVTLSWKRRSFRSTVNLNPSTIGTDATGETGHNHSHAHTLGIAGGLAINENLQVESTNGAGPLGTPGAAFNDNATVQSNAAGSSGHSHSHSHTLSGGGSQVVTDSPTIGTVTGISVDGRDVTAALGGPWLGNMIELDITSVFQKASGDWHEVAFSVSDLTRLVSLVRVYYTTS